MLVGLPILLVSEAKRHRETTATESIFQIKSKYEGCKDTYEVERLGENTDEGVKPCIIRATRLVSQQRNLLLQLEPPVLKRRKWRRLPCT